MAEKRPDQTPVRVLVELGDPELGERQPIDRRGRKRRRRWDAQTASSSTSTTGGERMGEIRVWIDLDVGKADHHATVIDASSGLLLDHGVCNDEQAIERLLDSAGERAALVIDQPGSIGTLAVALASRGGIAVAYVMAIEHGET